MISTQSNISVNENLEESYSDARKVDFYQVDNLFTDSCFDVYSCAFYALAVRRAANHNNGFFELKKTTAAHLRISEKKVYQCRELLEFCNIIKIYRRRLIDDPKIEISSRIILLDKSKWSLTHIHRDAGDFEKVKPDNPFYNIEYVKFNPATEKYDVVRRFHNVPAPKNNDPYASGKLPPPMY